MINNQDNDSLESNIQNRAGSEVENLSLNNLKTEIVIPDDELTKNLADISANSVSKPKTSTANYLIEIGSIASYFSTIQRFYEWLDCCKYILSQLMPSKILFFLIRLIKKLYRF
jgi:hypothetical protein